MNTFSLESLLMASGKRMGTDLAERLIPHPGELGGNREEIIRQFLRAYLPSRFEVCSGFAFDSRGNLSKQLDIIVANSLVSPRFETAGGIRFFPCESVVAVGQVKSVLDSRRVLREAFANLESVKSLDRSAGGTALDTNGDRIDNLRNHLHQIFTFVFVIGEALDPDVVRDELMQHVLTLDPHLWPNVVFALDRYLATFCCDCGICPNPMDARGIAMQPASGETDILMKFYLLLGGAVEATRVANFSYWDYLRTAQSWSADVTFPIGDPPPYLHSIQRCPVKVADED